MMKPADFRAADGRLDSDGLRATLDGCLLGLGSLQRTVIRDGEARMDFAAWTGQDGLEQRLCALVEQLEHATGALDVLFGHAAGRPSDMGAEVLAREADHRIGNSLQTVVTMLDQQARRADADPVRDALQQAAARVQAVSQVHAALHAAPASCGIVPELDLHSYLGRLCTTLGQAMGVDGERRSLRVEVEPLAVSPETAQQLGLVVTELVTNALRHAFQPGQPGAVQVTGARQGDGSYRLCVADDGCGLPAGFDSQLRPSGLGLRLVKALAGQLQARLTVEGQAGTCLTLVLPAAGCQGMNGRPA